jgi:3-hydroxy acid dehydrogenase/malonic semialdehyde reductase
MSNQSIVFITGASSGFGAAAARRFAAAGHPLVLAARRIDHLQALRSTLRVRAHVIELDVRDGAAVAQAVRSLPPEFAAPDILLNNAGVSIGFGPAHQGETDDWDAMIDTNVKGLAYVTRALLAGMVERDRGHIVNVGSPAGHYPFPNSNIYGATKAFVRQFSLNLRADLLGRNIRVTCIEPGLAKTELFERRFGGDRSKAEALFKGIEPLRVDDVADAIYWCTQLPAHVNVNLLELMPTAQAFAPLAVARRAD